MNNLENVFYIMFGCIKEGIFHKEKKVVLLIDFWFKYSSWNRKSIFQSIFWWSVKTGISNDLWQNWKVRGKNRWSAPTPFSGYIDVKIDCNLQIYSQVEQRKMLQISDMILDLWCSFELFEGKISVRRN